MGSKKLDFADFLYISTRLKVLEAKNMTYDRYEKMIEAKNLAEAEAVLIECEYGLSASQGLSAREDKSAGGSEKLFVEELKKYYDLIRAHSPDTNMIDFFLYFYDCHNLKALIKSEINGSDGAHLFIDSCTIPYETAVSAVRDRNFSPYMENVAAAAPDVIASYAINRDPMLIDVDLDRAMYADLDVIVSGSKINSDYLRRYFTCKADLVNIIAAVRIFRLGYSQALLSRVLVPGGSFSADFFMSKFEGGEIELLESLRSTPYSVLSSDEKVSLSKLEKTADELLMSFIAEVKFSPFGPDSVIAFMIAKENEVKNVRVILSGKSAAGTASDTIRERLRSVYG